MHSSLSGLAMLAIFVAAAALMYLRLVPALLAVPAMALGIAAVAGAGLAGLGTTIGDGSVRLAPVIVTVIFGALLSRVTLSTGIAETIVAYAAEFGGDRPAALALALAAAVAVLFTSLTGLGAIIMVGSIVLPIMLTVGVSRKIAAALFLLAFALGSVFNIAQWTFYTKTFGVERAQLQPYAFVLAAIDLAALLAFAFVRFRRARGYATWAVEADEPLARARAPWFALVTPALPIVLYFAFGVPPIVAFALSALYGALATSPRKAVATLVAGAIRGTEDVAPAIILFMGIGMLLVATGLPSVKASLAPIVSAIAPRGGFGYVVLFGLFSPLALYRGPLNPYGVGIAVYTILAGLGVLPAVTLVAAVMAVVQVQNACDPTNTQNVWVANFTGVSVGEIAKLTLPFQVAVATCATLAVAFFGGRLLGVQPFALGSPAAAATQSAAAGLFAPQTADGTIAVVSGDAAPASLAAAAQVRSRIAHDGALRLAPVADVATANATDCARKPFAAIVRLTATPDDVGLALSDCADWPVDEWHVPRTADVRADALATFVRMQTWRAERPRVAQNLFAKGLAYSEGARPPTYFYTLFKTDDGEMRAFVRAGGGAYASGLRTNDIVEKVDGKYWWEYGTFQTQARAYDGHPHDFVVKRGASEREIVLGDPFVP